MATKVEIKNSVNPTSTYIGTKVRELIDSVEVFKSNKPLSVKKGDVFLYDIGLKTRPCVVIKVDNKLGVAYSVPMSSTKDELNICEAKSRFFGEGFLTRTVFIVKTGTVQNNFIGVYDGSKDLNIAIKKLKELFLKL